MVDYVIMSDRNIPIALPTGQTLLIGYTPKVIGLRWFKGSLKEDPVRTVHLDSKDWPGLYGPCGWNLIMLLELVLLAGSAK